MYSSAATILDIVTDMLDNVVIKQKVIDNFRMSYLQLILVHFKGYGQGRAYFHKQKALQYITTQKSHCYPSACSPSLAQSMPAGTYKDCKINATPFLPIIYLCITGFFICRPDVLIHRSGRQVRESGT